MRTKPFEKLEVGKTYLTRSGEQVKIAESTGCPTYPFEGGSLDASQDDTVGTDSWKTNGQYLSHEDNHRWDLVSEVIEDGGVDPGPYKTTGGLDAVVLATDAPDSEYPLVGYIVASSGHIDPTSWTEKGEYIKGQTNTRDLVLTPATVPTLREAAEDLLVEYVRYFNKYHDHLADPEQESVVKNLRAALAQSEQ